MLTSAKKIIILGGRFSPLSLFPTAFYVPVISSLFKTTDTSQPVTSDGDTVGRENDLSSNGNNQIQSTAGSRPAYHTGSGRNWLTFDGSDDQISLDFVAGPIAQPHEVVAAARIVSSGANCTIIGGGNSTNYGNIFYNGSNISLFSGSVLPGPTQPSDGVDFVVTGRFNGASSRIAVDNGPYTVGDAGANAKEGFSVGGFGGGFSANILFYGAVLVPRLLVDSEIAKLRTYFAALQGRVL